MQKFFDYITLKFYRFVNKVLGTKLSFSADGEDVILKKFFSGIETGFYVDLGAHNYIDGSNTYYFYLQGWKGICVDPLPGLKKKFKKKRPKDIFLDNAIVPNSFNKQVADFYFFEDFPDNSTVSKNRIDDLTNSFERSSSKVMQVRAISVSSFIKNYIGTKEINLLNIDIEGGEFHILSDFMKEKIFPWVICVEEIGMYADSIITKSQIYRILIDNSYLLMQRTFLSSIYVHSSSLKKFQSPYTKEIILDN
jgi:FkbM family methyltransferase